MFSDEENAKKGCFKVILMSKSVYLAVTIALKPWLEE